MVVEYTSAASYDFMPQQTAAAAGAKSAGDPALAKAGSGEQKDDGEFRLFGKDGLTFSDVLDIVNPLQHIPIVSTLYRAITGDQIDPAARVAGGTLYGGPIGAAVSAVNVVVEHSTGKDIGDHVASLVLPDEVPETVVAGTSPPVPGAPQPSLGAVDQQLASLTRAATPANIAGMTAIPVVHPASSPAAAPANTNVAGMSAIPVVREDVIAKFFERPNALAGVPGTPATSPGPAAVPDLGALSDPVSASTAAPGSPAIAEIVRANQQALKAEIAATTARPNEIPGATSESTPATLAEFETAAGTGLSSTAALVASTPSASTNASASAAIQSGNNWVVEAMIRALDKYEGAAKLRNGSPSPASSVVR